MQHFSYTLQHRTILITGGAGYIGRIVQSILEQAGATVWILDDLSGNSSPLRKRHFIKMSLLDKKSLDAFFQSHSFDAVVHLAGKINVGESVFQPDLYWAHNVTATQHLIDSMKSRCANILFASSAAVYGNHTNAVHEMSPCNPTSPYGEGKLAAEQYIQQSSLSSIVFRLFNVAGAIQHPINKSEMLGEEHNPETHLIPRVIQTHLAKRTFSIFGNQYDTPNGTCLREYIHVLDVAKAIASGIHYMTADTPSKSSEQHRIFNLSSGHGYSVLNVVQTISECGIQLGYDPIQYTFDKSRVGDPGKIASTIEAVQSNLKWEPRHSNLIEIVNSAWKHQLSQLKLNTRNK